MVFAQSYAGEGPDLGRAKRAVLSVGSGCGFVVASKSGPLIVTAADCLPFFPPDGAESLLEERTFQNLIGPLGGRQAIWAECLFADRAADIAVLGPPDSQELEDKYEAHRNFVDECESLIVTNPMRRSWGHFLSSKVEWLPCELRHQNGPLWILARDEVGVGLSGSPLLDPEGGAVGVFVAKSKVESDTEIRIGPNPHLAYALPDWLVSMMKPRFGAR